MQGQNQNDIQNENTKQNKKAKPNENFARELMELFTLGINNYSEADIKASARAFTGYSFDYWGNFKLIEKHHDFSDKTFFGNIFRSIQK